MELPERQKVESFGGLLSASAAVGPLQMARRTGMPVNTISRGKRGIGRKCPWQTVAALAYGVGLSPTDLGELLYRELASR